ncbi:MAG: LysR family transcriptional regulator [Sandaracinaceae bacterium]
MSDLLAAPLRYFQEVARAGSFTSAARELGISQPSLSVAVQKLEESIGAPLFHRSRQGVTLTRAGEILLEHARQAERALEAARDEVLALASEPRGRFRLGSHESLAAYVLPGFMARFFERYPAVQITLHNGNSRDVERSVIERTLDLALVVNPTRHPDCVIAELTQDRVGFVVATALKRRYAGRSEDLLREVPWIHVPVLQQTQFIVGAMAKRGIVPASQLTCSSMELVKSLVLDGVGVGVLPFRVASHGVNAGKLAVLEDALPVFDDTIALVWRYDLPMTAGARALLDELRAHGRSLPALNEVLADRGPSTAARKKRGRSTRSRSP